MKGTYNPYHDNGPFNPFNHGVWAAYDKGKLQQRKATSFTYSGCHITLTEKQDPTSPWYSDIYATTVEIFNLRDIDPTSIKVYPAYSEYFGLSCKYSIPNALCDIGAMDFKTRNDALAIQYKTHTIWSHWKGKHHDHYFHGTDFGSYFLFNNLHYAYRFEKAFRHAVKLCGGKAAPF